MRKKRRRRFFGFKGDGLHRNKRFVPKDGSCAAAAIFRHCTGVSVAEAICFHMRDWLRIGWKPPLRKGRDKGVCCSHDKDTAPYAGFPHTEEPHTEEPHTEEPYAEEPYAENRTQLNTNILNTYILNTDILSTDR